MTAIAKQGFSMMEGAGEEEQKKKAAMATGGASFDQDCFVLDMDSLSSLLAVSAGESDQTTPDSLRSVQKGLGRKGSQRAERKAAPPEGGEAFKGTSTATTASSRTTSPEKPMIVVHSPGALGHVGTPLSANARSQSIRRRRASSPWLDPRRVLFFFATLSSMGTLILLFFTLSMSKTGDVDSNTW